MNLTHGSPPPTGPLPDAAGVLVAALDAAPAAVWFLAGPDGEVVWANAAARRLAAVPTDLPAGDGHRVGDVVEAVLRSGRSASVRGPLDAGGAPATAVVQPLRVEGRPGALVLVEPGDARGPAPGVPLAPPDLVELAQHALLPPSLPLLPDLWLSGSYHRASSVSAAGGDWYDVVPLGAGRLALAIGDAVGAGVPAAGAMGRLRGALRSVVLRDPSPVAVVSALDAVAAQMDDVEGASVLYAVVEAGSGRVRYAAAGHPGPLIARAGGGVEFLPLTPRPPLGCLPGVPTVASTAELGQGDTLVLFSDGALRVAGPAPAEGMARLGALAGAVVADAGDLPSPDLADALTAGLIEPGDRPDDVAVLVAHRRSDALAPLELDLPGVPASLPAVRRRLGTWLAALGMGEQDRVGVMVAVGEACANAAEHAYRGREPGRLRVAAGVDVDGLLTVTVRDEGRWRPPDRDPGDRGRGLLIMRQLVDGVVLQEEHGTTVTLSMRLRRSPEEEAEQRPGGVGGAEVVVDRSGERPVVQVSGSADLRSAEQLRIRLLEASAGGTCRVELDLTAVTLFSSAAVRVVLAMARIAGEEGWRLVVHAPEGGVTRHVLEISGLGGLVDLR